MALRIQPRQWQQLLLAAAGLVPFTACGGATDVNFFEPVGGSSTGGASTKGGTSSKGGSKATAGEAGNEQGGSVNLAGNGMGGSITIAGAGTAGVSNGGAGPVNRFPCVKPVPFPIPGSGYELCEGDFVHRVGKAACAAGGQCLTDDQCGSGQLCVCEGGGGGVCQTSSCESDSDCLPGFLCIGGSASFGCGFGMGFSCQVPADQCAGNLDCADSCSGCVGNATNPRACQPCCAVGRPFLVAGAARMAKVAERADWGCAGLDPNLSNLSPAERQALSCYWQDTALLEHASVAAFARFSLDLLSLGAPAELIEAATAAMQDETRHARACFALASAFAGSALGPAELQVQGSLDQRGVFEIVVTTVLEGCIGETVAALEAAEALERATDPAVRQALSQIAEDELRHAALAYRFVGWAVARYGAALERVVRETFATALSETPTDMADDQAVPSHGLLPATVRRELRARVLRELVAPTLPSLLAA